MLSLCFRKHGDSVTPPKKGRVVWLVVYTEHANDGWWYATKAAAKNNASSWRAHRIIRAVITLPTPKKERT